ncbi:MAG: universal stress protein [Sporolactobacillus sp.]
MHMFKIVVPIDGSEPAGRALDEALALAEGKEEVEVTLLYVSPSPIYFPYYSMVGPSLSADAKEIEEREGNKLLDDLVAAKSQTNVKFVKKHLYGIVAQQICDYANDTKTDLIVMGQRGLGAFGQMLLGSVSNKVLQLAQSPVVIVK